MKLIAKFLAFAGLAVLSVEGSVRGGDAIQNQLQRRLDDSLCAMCDLCDILSDLCDATIIAGFACDLCDIVDPPDDDGGDDPDSDVCFSEVATVQVLQPNTEVTTVAMKDLQVGDKILTSQNQYETVYAFGHHNPTKLAQFYQIHNDNNNDNNPLEVTADHLVFINGKTDPVAASTVQVGDVLQSLSEGSAKVTKITTVEREGIYAPLTTGGKLVVDGVVASSYINLGQKQDSILSDHSLIHMTLSPYRMVCNGINAHFCNTNTYDEDGMPYYVQYGLCILHWMNSINNAILQAVVLTVIVAATGTLFAWEQLFGPSLAPLMAFLAALAYTSYQNNNKSKAKQL